MVIRTFFDKNNTIIKNEYTNTGLNPVTELFYGGNNSVFSRYIFHFDETKLRDLYTGGTYTDLTKLKHTLKMTNTSSFDTDLLNKSFCGKKRATSLDLIVFKIDTEWDEGVGYDFNICNITDGECAYSTSPSNWFNPTTSNSWSEGTGIYTGTPSTITVGTQHFDHGNENLEIDVTDYVNSILTGDTNYGLGVAFNRMYELLRTSEQQYIGFFTRHTQTIYEPHIETIYNETIKDDRNNFYLDKNNKLYLYVNINGSPTNLDNIPTVNVYNNDGNLFSSYTQNDVTHVTKGVYSINILVPTTSEYSDCVMFNDVWSGITINGVNRPAIELSFALKNSLNYYNIGDNVDLPKETSVSISGIHSDEKIKRGDVRKIIVSARIPYTIEQTQNIDNLKYRVYIKEGRNELSIIDWQPIQMSNNYYYFLLDTNSLLPNKYYLDVLTESNLSVKTLKEVITFNIVSQSELRKS